MKKLLVALVATLGIALMPIGSPYAEAGSFEWSSGNTWGTVIVDDTSLWTSNDGATEYRGAYITMLNSKGNAYDQGSITLGGGARGIWIASSNLQYQNSKIVGRLWGYIGKHL